MAATLKTPPATVVDLRVFVDAIVGEVAGSARARDVTLGAVLEVERIVADEDLLRRTRANLVQNAVHHAPPMRETIFGPFVPLDPRELPPSRSGGGLGLTFCRLAVEAHVGRIWIEGANPGAAVALRISDAE